MSHFTVLVIGSDWEEQLAKFQENNMGDCPEEFMEFEDVEDDYYERWLTETVKRVVSPSGELLSPYDKQFDCYPDSEKPYKRERVIPESFKEVDMPCSEVWKTFEEYMEDYCGFSERNEEFGRYGYWENPNAKWDWYQVGGRWNGYFKVKQDIDISNQHLVVAGEPGLMGKEADAGYADQLLKGDIDFEGMYKEAMDRAAQEYDEFLEKTKGLPIPPTWAEVRENCATIEEAREIYNNYPWVKAIRSMGPLWGDTHEYFYIDKGGRETFIENAKCNALVPFALLMDGEWYEKGEMGWWGMVADEKLSYDWATEFKLMFEDLPEDTLVTLVDCHI